MQEYPLVYNESEGALATILKRIVELRREDVAEFSEIQRIRGYQSGFVHSTKSISANYSTGAADLYLGCDATTGAITVTLSASPIDGQKHHIIKIDSSGNAITIDGNSNNINGSSTASLAAQYDSKTLVFMGGSGEWIVL